MADEEKGPADPAYLEIPQVGALIETCDPWEPVQLVGPDGVVVRAVSEYLKDLQAAGRAAATQRSYGMDLLRWFRFLWAVEVSWHQATRSEGRDFSRWMQIADKPAKPHWRAPDNAVVPGKGTARRKYSAATRAHCETVLRHFYDFHLEVGTGPIVNPFPLARGRHRHRPGAHQSPMEPPRDRRSGLFRPRPIRRLPRCIPDHRFNELFAGLSCHRDRALVAFWVSTGARASELLGATRGDANPGSQVITVVRKGTRAIQQLPAAPDAFVWLRLYQAEADGLVPPGNDQPLWWTLRRPFRALTYHAARAMFGRAGAALGAKWTLHDLRHTASYRMARDPEMPLTDVQWVLGHAHLSTTQIYVSAPLGDVVESVIAHHRRQRDQAVAPGPPPQSSGYRSETLDILFPRRTKP
jgi:site-specific recombinase XerD